MAGQSDKSRQESDELALLIDQGVDRHLAAAEKRLQGQIEELQRKVSLLERRVSDLENIEQREVRSLEERLSDLEEEEQDRG